MQSIKIRKENILKWTFSLRRIRVRAITLQSELYNWEAAIVKVEQPGSDVLPAKLFVGIIQIGCSAGCAGILVEAAVEEECRNCKRMTISTAPAASMRAQLSGQVLQPEPIQ